MPSTRFVILAQSTILKEGDHFQQLTFKTIFKRIFIHIHVLHAGLKKIYVLHVST